MPVQILVFWRPRWPQKLKIYLLLLIKKAAYSDHVVFYRNSGTFTKQKRHPSIHVSLPSNLICWAKGWKEHFPEAFRKDISMSVAHAHVRRLQIDRPYSKDDYAG